MELEVNQKQNNIEVTKNPHERRWITYQRRRGLANNLQMMILKEESSEEMMNNASHKYKSHQTNIANLEDEENMQIQREDITCVLMQKVLEEEE